MLDLQSLNEAQLSAVTCGEGPVLVLAGPGSGKTFTITQRIFYLLQEYHIAPENILVVTFTKDAALSMQQRFKEQSDLIRPVNFGTFHSIFYHILRQSHNLQKSKIATENQKKEIMLSLLRSRFPGEGNMQEGGLFLAAISLYKNTGEEESAVKMLPEERRESFHDIFPAYERERKSRGLLDFDDMVYECREMLMRDKEILKYWQNRFSHILLDEFQDINPVQYDVIRLLTREHGRIFAVGDDDQSIYGFRGSRPACLKSFAQDFHAKQIYLTVNYRSSKAIVEASLAVISENRDRFDKRLTAAFGQAAEQAGRQAEVQEDVKGVILHSFEDREEQYNYLIKRLQACREQQGSLAVLFRTNSYMQGLAARLNKMGIPYSMKEKVTSIYGHFIVQDIMAYLRIVSGEETRELLLQILNKPLRYLNREALGRAGDPDGERESVRERDSIGKRDSDWNRDSAREREICGKGENRGEDGRIGNLEEMFRNIKDYYENQEGVLWWRERIREAEKLQKDLGYLKKLPLYLQVQYILKGMGYERYLKEKAAPGEEKQAQWQEILEWICEDAKGYEDLKEWRSAQEKYENTLQEKREGEQQIRLMTVHASKGLEFDHVWIPDCNENVFPHGRMLETDACEEERRIFYVAMTRAKKSLELLYTTGTKERPRQPSRFLNPLFKGSSQSDSSSTSSSNSQLSRYSSKASATFSYSSSSSI